MAIAALLVRSVSARLALGWGLGFVISLLGLVASAAWDLPTGATVVTTFGVSMAAVAVCLGLRILIQATRARGLSALTGAGIAALAVLALAGLLLVIVPQMDHHWLNLLERAAPSVQLAFLTSDERETYKDTKKQSSEGRARSNGCGRCSNRSSGEHEKCPKRCGSARDSI